MRWCQAVLRHLVAAWDGNHLHWHEKTDCLERCWLRTIRFFVSLNPTSPINPILTESLYCRFIHRFGVSLAEVHVTVGFGEVGHVEGYLLVYGAVGVEQGVGEEPVVGLAHIEEACRSTVVGALQPGVAQTGVVAGLLEVVDHRFRLAYGYRPVGSAVDYPEGQLAERRAVFLRTAATHSQSRRHFVGICAGEVEGAISAETHSDDIHTGGVAGIVLFRPFQHVVYLLRVPRSAGVLRHHHQSIYLPALHYGVERSVASYPVQVSSAEALSVQEYYHRSLVESVVIFRWGVNPEVVATGYGVFHGAYEVVLGFSL